MGAADGLCVAESVGAAPVSTDWLVVFGDTPASVVAEVAGVSLDEDVELPEDVGLPEGTL